MPDDVLEMTYERVLMYSLATPTYNSKKAKNEPEFDESLDANNPDNFKNLEIDDE